MLTGPQRLSTVLASGSVRVVGGGFDQKNVLGVTYWAPRRLPGGQYVVTLSVIGLGGGVTSEQQVAFVF